MANKKSGRVGIEQRVEELVAPVAQEYGCFIYDVDYIKEGNEYYLNIYIDKEGGVTINDCENVSRRVSDLLDEKDFIRDAYTLVVSSPGLGRTLTKDRHLAQSIGELVEIGLYKPMEETKEKTVVGVLESFDKETITVTFETTEGDSVTKAIGRKEIAVIRLYLEF